MVISRIFIAKLLNCLHPITHILSYNINNQLSVTNDYDCILAMLLGSSRNGRSEVTQFSVPTTSETVSVIRRDAKRNTFGLTAPGSHVFLFLFVPAVHFAPYLAGLSSMMLI